jgi:hypothetical protein
MPSILNSQFLPTCSCLTTFTFSPRPNRNGRTSLRSSNASSRRQDSPIVEKPANRCGNLRYHERVLRNDEATEAVVRYVLENPIRARLSKELGEYPFAGSAKYDLDALKTAWETQS